MADFLSSWLGAPDGLAEDPAAGLLGNSAFRLGLGLLQARYDGRTNPVTAGLGGLLGAQNFRGEYLKQQEELDQIKRDKALRGSLRRLLDPTDPTTQMFRTEAQNTLIPAGPPTGPDFDPNSGTFNLQGVGGLLGPEPQPGPGSLIDPNSRSILGELSTADPKAAATLYASILGDETRPSSLHNPPSPIVGQPYPGGDGKWHVFDRSTNQDRTLDVDIPQDYSLTTDPSGRTYFTGKSTPPGVVPGGEASDVQQRKIETDRMQTRYNYQKDLPAKEQRLDQLQSEAEYLSNKDTPLAHGIATYFPTLRGTDTRNWEAAHAQFVANNTIDTLVNMRSDKTGATGFGALQEKELDLVIAAAQRAIQATSKADWDSAMKTYNYWLGQTRANARQLAGLKPDDASYNLRTAPIPSDATGGAPTAVPRGAPAYINPNTPPAGVDPAVWAKYHTPAQ
jgi:hypothetical protein